MKNNQSDTHATSAIRLPKVIFGTSGLGNLFVAQDDTTKLNIVRECIQRSPQPTVFDSAGKYGAGLALESLGHLLRQLDVQPSDVVISNKLGWLRTELTTSEPTFEPGVWKDLKHDAVQAISYDGIMKCFEQGNELLGGYTPQLVSVHDPDEYLARATDALHEEQLYQDILSGYRALADLKHAGRVALIGVGSKDWKVIQRLSKDVSFDWVMFANSLTIFQHPPELLAFVESLDDRGIHVINSAVFHSGFLVGSDYFNYKRIAPNTPENSGRFQWRSDFFEICNLYKIKPAHACVQFALSVPGVKSIAMNTTDAKRVQQNVDMASIELPASFWEALSDKGLVKADFLL
jgi:D-threo-aldose 1-dehydrogenase